MTISVKTIDVANPDQMALVKVCPAHSSNPFIFRIECEIDTCKNQVWPSQLYDVRGLDHEITGGVSFACDGCVETWIREPGVDLDALALMRAHGASKSAIKSWQKKCQDAKPDNVMIEGATA